MRRVIGRLDHVIAQLNSFRSQVSGDTDVCITLPNYFAANEWFKISHMAIGSDTKGQVVLLSSEEV